MATKRQTRQQRAAAIGGIVWVTMRATGERFALVPASKGGYHKVGEAGCDCAGFQHRGWCCHSDAVTGRIVARKGWQAKPAPSVEQDINDLFGPAA